MAIRDQSFIDRVARAERDLFDFKNAQIFGKDVTTPKVIERYNSDGTPTEWDVIGEYNTISNVWNAQGSVTYTSKTQSNPWATIYAKVRVNPANEITAPDSVGFDAYADLNAMFENDSNTIVFKNVGGSASASFGPPYDTTIDRIWIKIYVLASDYGDIKLTFPDGNFGAGTVVPLT